MPIHATPASGSSILNFARVLVASQDSATVEFLNHNLREWGYVPVQVHDGLSAARLLMEPNPPRIAILDSLLPNLRMEEVCTRVPRSEGIKPVWIVMLCKEVNRSIATSATEAGVDDLLIEPLDAAELRIRISVADRVQSLFSQLEALEGAARFHESHDKLTGLLNRESLLRLLFAETDRAQRMNTPLTLVVMDLDHFSRINLDYGYHTGDRILRELARRLRRYMRSYDLIGRCGEDEFLIALPGTVSDEAFALAQRVKRTILHRPFCVGRDMLTLTASAGISHSHGRSPLVVLREAEQALASAKLSGRNCERQYAQLEAQQAQRSDQRTLSLRTTKH